MLKEKKKGSVHLSVLYVGQCKPLLFACRCPHVDAIKANGFFARGQASIVLLCWHAIEPNGWLHGRSILTHTHTHSYTR